MIGGSALLKCNHVHHMSPINGPEHEKSGHHIRHIEAPSWKDLFTYTTKNDLYLLVVAITCSIVASIANPAQAFITGKIFNGFVQLASGVITADDFLIEQRAWITYLVVIGGTSWIFHTLEYASWTRFGEVQAKHARTRLYQNLANMDMTWFDTCEGGIETLLPRLQSQIRDLQLATSQPLGGILSLLSTSLIALGQAFYFSWDLTLVTLAGSPLIVATIIHFGISMQTAIDKQQTARSNAQASVYEALANFETVNCFNAQQFEFDKYKTFLEAAAGWYGKVTKSNALQMSILTFLVQSMFVQAFYYGGVLIKAGKKQSSQVITTFFSAITAFQAVQGVMPQLVVLEKGKHAGLSLKQAISSQASAASISGNIKSFRCAGNIQFRSVSFAYASRPDSLVLDSIDLILAGGQFTFLVGESGCGKSTIGQLLVSFYEPDTGDILLDGESLSNLNASWLRSNVLLVEQSSTLLQGTIRDNIKLALTHEAHASEEEIQSAIEFALLQHMVHELPEGLSTQLGSGGLSLSGGQRQRMALARARLRNPAVLILDESTSALDQISRELMLAAIRQWRQGKTTIVVTHDLSQILQDDYVVMLAAGKIVQEGNRKQMEADKQSPFGVMLDNSHHPELHRVIPESTAVAASTTLAQRPSFLAAASVYLDRMPFQVQLTPPIRQSYMQSSAGFRSTLQSLPDFVQNAGQHALARRRSPTTGRRRRRRALVQTNDQTLTVGPSKHASIFQMTRQEWQESNTASRMSMLLGLFAGSVHAACSPVFSYVLAKLLQLYAQPESTVSQALAYSMAILGIALVDAVNVYIYRNTLEWSAQTWVDRLRMQSMQRLFDQTQDFFDCGKESISGLVTTLDGHAEEMRNLFGRFIIMLYIALIIILIALIWATTAQWKMTLLAITAAPYIFFATKMYAFVVEKWERRNTDAIQTLNDILSEAFGKIRTVRALTLEKHYHRRFLQEQRLLERLGVRRACWIGLGYGMSTSAAMLATAMVFYTGTKLAYDGASVAAILLVFTILILTISNVSTIFDFVPQVGSAKEMASRVLRLAELSSLNNQCTGRVQLNTVGMIHFKRIHFAYPTRPEVTVLEIMDLKIRPGSTVAIVGASGSGKSSIAKLLLKLYSAQRGALKISGRNIATIDTASLRCVVAVVTQTSPLFRASIWINITYGLPERSQHRQKDNIIRACRLAGILDFIDSLPEAFETRIGEGGVGLSGGQIQRIAIARALVRCPSLLILDEATSALDARAAALIRDTVRGLVETQGQVMTILMITHSQDMMAIAKDIVVLDEGRVVERGLYSTLRQQEGHFARLLRGGTIEA